jgi:hypothetical protein
VGLNDMGGIIIGCYSISSVSGNEDVGGLVGSNDYTITNCYSVGSVTGTSRIGGLVASNCGKVTNCYSTGSVSSDESVGGLVGYMICGFRGNEQGTVTNCFWDTQTSGQATSAAGTGLTTAQMQDVNTFVDADWEFVGQPNEPHDVWIIPSDGAYPILAWQLPDEIGLPGFSGGTGEPDDPYLISTATELNSIGHNPRLMKGHFKLINDIDLADVDFFIIGNELFPFTGVFDGNGHTISNFSYTYTERNYIGLFGYVGTWWGKKAVIKDLGLIGPNVDAGTRDYVGSLVGELIRGTINGCYAQGGSVSGNENVGGLVGNNNEGDVVWCYSTGTVSGNEDVGGLVGDNHQTITNCYATGSVMGIEDVGGLVGHNFGTITNCYSTGSVSGETKVGGLVGGYWNGTINDCYSTGSVAGNEKVGGLVGDNEYGEVRNSFWDTQTSGQLTSASGKGRTTAEMQTAGTFLEAGWDFVDETANGNKDIWWILEGQDYPRLWWELHEDR